MTSFLVRGLLSLTLVAASVANAAITRDTVDQFAIQVWKVRTAFHTYSVMQGDPTYLETLEYAIEDGADLVDTMSSAAETEEEIALVTQLESDWSEFEDLANSNTIVDLGYTDRYTVLDLDALATKMVDAVTPLRADLSEPGRDLLLIASDLQNITSEYMGIAASPDGGGTVGTSEVRLDFAVAVPALDDALAKARERYADNDMVMRTLGQVSSKWTFMRESLVKFNENSVPFVVNRYTTSIVESLDMVASSLQGN